MTIERKQVAWLAVVGALAVWGLTDVRARAHLDSAHLGHHRTDLTVYTLAGRALWEGGDPYAIVHPRGWGYLYPPFFAAAIGPLGYLAPQWQGVIWFLISVVLAYGCLYECGLCGMLAWRHGKAREGGAAVRPPGWIGIMAFVAVLLPMLDCLQRGQVGLLVLYLLLLGVRMALTPGARLSDVMAGIVLALAGVIKVTPLLPAAVGLLYLLQWSYGRFARVATGMLLGTVAFWLVIPAAISGWRVNLENLSTWRAVVQSGDLHTSGGINPLALRNQSLAVAIHRVSALWRDGEAALVNIEIMGAQSWQTEPFPPTEATGWTRSITIVRIGVLALLALSSFCLARSPDPLGLLAVFGLACVASLLISPIAWGHHFVVLMPAVLFVPGWLLVQGRKRASAFLSGGATLLVVAHYTLMPASGVLGLLAFGMLGWFVLGCGLACMPASHPPARLPASTASSSPPP